MLPNPATPVEKCPEYPGLSVNQLTDWRNDQLQFQQWRFDASTEQDYVAGNQFTEEDRQEMLANGIPIITINRIQHQINSVIGIQRSNLTDLKLTAEDPEAQDATDALNVKVHEAERTSKLRRARLDAAKTAATVGIGWVEIGRSADPFKPAIKAWEAPWREMSWDYQNGPYIEDWAYTRRTKFYLIDRLKAHFPGKGDAIDKSSWSTDSILQWADMDQQYRAYDKRNWRDVPLSWNWSPSSIKNYRLLEEVFYQVQMEGVIVRLPSGRVIAYDDCNKKPMIQLAIKSGMAELEEATYSRWRRSYWINDLCLKDEWSPLPFNENPYTPIWCYREEQTGVPYGLVRVMRSIQDAINTLEAKMMFSINAKQVEFEEGSIDITMWQQQIGRKNGFLPVKPGYYGKVKVNEHEALNEQHFKLYQDLLTQIETVGGTAGLNPAALGQKPRSGVLANQMLAQAMSALGEFNENCSDAAIRTGAQLTELVREDIEKQGNVQVEVQRAAGRKQKIMLHQKIGMHEEHVLISNDVTLLNTQVALEEVPHTATYRAGQLDNLAIALQSLPPNDPTLTKIRAMLTSLMLRCMDIPGAAEMSQQVLEALGLAPPETPEEQAEQQAQQQKQAEAEALQKEMALSQINKNNASAMKDEATAQHHLALASSESQPDPLDDAERRVQLAKQASQVEQIGAKTDHTKALTALTAHKTAGEAIQNVKDVQEPQEEALPPGW